MQEVKTKTHITTFTDSVLLPVRMKHKEEGLALETNLGNKVGG